MSVLAVCLISLSKIIEVLLVFLFYTSSSSGGLVQFQVDIGVHRIVFRSKCLCLIGRTTCLSCL